MNACPYVVNFGVIPASSHSKNGVGDYLLYKREIRVSYKEDQMGATSVTGRGNGSADGMNKGSSRSTLGVDHLIGPRVVNAGVVTMSASTKDVDFPTLSGVVGDYSVQLTASNSTAVFVTDFTVDGFTINGASGQTIYWSLFKNGLSESDVPN
jgi:hypothetical protein